MAVELKSSYGQASTDSNGFTTSGVDTSGASLIFILVSCYGSVTAPVLTDSKGNSWTELVEQSDGTTRCKTYYAYDPSKVDASHTFTLAQNGSYCSIAVAAFSGTKTSSDPLTDQQGNFQSTGDPTITAPSITAATGGDLMITCEATHSANVASVDNGGSGAAFAILQQGSDTGNARGYALAWKTITGTFQPTWTIDGHVGMTNAAFAQTAGAAADAQEWLTNTVVQQSRKNSMIAY